MRVVSWNMGYMRPAAYKTTANRRRQWALLGALAPDIAVLQECRPDDLFHHAPAWMAQAYCTIGEIPKRWIACSTVLARRDLDPRPLEREGLPEPERRWLSYLSGYVATAEVLVERQRLFVASVHAIAKPVTDPAISEADHERIRRRALPCA